MTEALPPLWQAGHDEHLICVAVRPETHDVSTFVFAPAEARLFRFQPGQFMTFDLVEAGVQRCYTIASPPTRPWRIEITAKRTPDGIGSSWLHEKMRPGMRLTANGPMGEFTFSARPGCRALFLSGGSGITPLMSMARTAHDLGAECDIVFIHSARSPRDLVFDDELAAMARRAGFRRFTIVDDAAAGASWDGLRGRLTAAMLGVLAPDLKTREIWCCGPAPYMAAVRMMLDELGFDRGRYHEESFAFAEPGPLDADLPATHPQTTDPDRAAFTIQFARLGKTVQCPPDMTILAAARAAGLRLPSACQKGVCGTCKSRLVSGSVDLHHGGGIRPREIDAGYTLLCCAKPLADLVVDR